MSRYSRYVIDKMFNIAMGIYIIVAILIGIGGVMAFVKSQRMVSAGIFFIGALAVFIVFGIRWFDSSSSLFSESPVKWPPAINTCPDFLTYYRRKKSDGTSSDTCIDRVGISRNGALQVFPKNGDVNPDNDAYFFPLPKGGVTSKQVSEDMCKQAIQYGLTWEGITDGQSCISFDGKEKTTTQPPSSSSCNNECPSCDATSTMKNIETSVKGDVSSAEETLKKYL